MDRLHHSIKIPKKLLNRRAPSCASRLQNTHHETSLTLTGTDTRRQSRSARDSADSGTKSFLDHRQSSLPICSVNACYEWYDDCLYPRTPMLVSTGWFSSQSQTSDPTFFMVSRTSSPCFPLWTMTGRPSSPPSLTCVTSGTLPACQLQICKATHQEPGDPCRWRPG